MIQMKKDLTVIGAGLSGICAAISAARQGLSVALVSNRPVLGGNSSSEMRMWTRGATGGENIYAEEMGILGEMKLENLYRNPEGNVIFWDEVLYDFVHAEPLIELFLNTHISEIVMDVPVRISQVSGYQQGTEKSFGFLSEVYIDATGDGTIGHLAGVSFTEGREGKDVYGERLAPEKSDDFKLGSSILFHTRESKRHIRYIAPKYAYTRDQILSLIGKGGRVVHERMSGTDYWWIEYGGMMDTIGGNQDIALELKKIVFGIWDYIKNSGEFPAENLTLEWIGSLPCKRESRRLKGEYVLTLDDLEKCNNFPDGISYGGWYVDFHPPGGIYAKEENCKQVPVSVYPIPMRCLYTKAVDNLLFTGRLISTSHLAFASTRIMDTCALLGQAAGMVAVYMHMFKASHHTIYEKYRKTLQEDLLKNDMFIPYVKHHDDGDLARKAEITVSSVRPLKNDSYSESIPLDDDFLMLFPGLGKASLQVNLDVKEDSILEMSLYSCEQKAGFRPGAIIKSFSLSLSAGMDQWISIIEPTDVECSYYLALSAHTGVSLRCSERGFTGFTGRYRREKRLYNPSFRVVGEASINDAGNLVNGYSRPYGVPNLWSSADDGPAWIQCTWESDLIIQEIRLFFNPNLSSELVNLKGEYYSSHHGMFLHEMMPPELERVYTISIWNGYRWEKIVGINNNIKRMAVHKLDRQYHTSKIRIDLLETWGSPHHDVFEIRVY